MALIQLGTDDFNRDDGLLNGDNGWTEIGGSPNTAISSNMLAWGAAAGRALYQETSHADHYVQCVIKSVASNAGCPLMVRCVDVSNWIGVRINSGNYQVLNCIAAAVTANGANVSAASAAADDVWRLEAEGSDVRFYVDDALIMTRTVADTTATKAGTLNRSGAIDPILDDMVWGYIGTAGAGGPLIGGKLLRGNLIGGRLAA